MPKKQKSGLYRTKVTIGHDADGKPIYKYVSGSTKAELEREKQKVIAYHINGTGLDQDQLFGKYAVDWYHVRKEPFIQPSTQRSYRSMINLHVLPAFCDRNMRAIRAVELQDWLNGFAGKSDSQITLAMTILRGIFGAALADRVIPFDPTVGLREPSATPPEVKRALTEAERKTMKEVAATHPRGLYLAAMYYLGVRPGEARGLKWGDFDFNEKIVHIQRDIDYAAKDNPVGELKTKAADREIPIPDELLALLLPKRGHPEAFLFQGDRSGRPLAQASAVRWWLELMIACGMAVPIEESEYKQDELRAQYEAIITPHYLRHNFITMCWENGLDVMVTMKLVGHADIRTTMNIYTHLNRKHLEKARVKLNDMFSGKVAQKLHKRSTGKK